MKSIDYCPNCGTECMKEVKTVKVQMQMANPVPPVEVERTYYTATFNPADVRKLIELVSAHIDDYTSKFLGISELIGRLEIDLTA